MRENSISTSHSMKQKFNLFSDVFGYGNFPLEPKAKLRNFCKKHLLKGRLSTHPVISLKASSQLSIS